MLLEWHLNDILMSSDCIFVWHLSCLWAIFWSHLPIWHLITRWWHKNVTFVTSEWHQCLILVIQKILYCKEWHKSGTWERCFLKHNINIKSCRVWSRYWLLITGYLLKKGHFSIFSKSATKWERKKVCVIKWKKSTFLLF